MKLVVMTKSTYFVEEDKIISMLFEEGLDCLCPLVTVERWEERVMMLCC